MAMYKICSSCGKRINHSEDCECKKKRQNTKGNNYKTQDPFYSRAPWMNKRLKILDRDNYVCQRCLIKFNYIENEFLQVHHIKSRLHYPELSLDDENLICLCRTCNLQLGTTDKLDFDWEPPSDTYEYNL